VNLSNINNLLAVSVHGGTPLMHPGYDVMRDRGGLFVLGVMEADRGAARTRLLTRPPRRSILIDKR
jgi:hypothetical protein